VHHNLYGYFIETALTMCRSGGRAALLVLKNAVSLVQYPGDAPFHQHLLDDHCLETVTFFEGSQDWDMPFAVQTTGTDACRYNSDSPT